MDVLDPQEVHDSPDPARPEPSQDAAVLLEQIEQACRHLKMAQSTFGRLAVNDGKLVTRLQQGGRVTLTTVERVHRFIEAQGGSPMDTLRSAIRGLNVAAAAPDFRFFDNRQKYLMFVNTTSEKRLIADRALRVMEETQPQSPALRVMDAGAGDGTALARIMRGMHRRHPHAPFYVVAKEISMENVRLILEKMADRLQEHPATVLVITNLKFSEALRMKPHPPSAASSMIWHEQALDGNSAGDFEEQIAELDPWLAQYWSARISTGSGNPVYRTPMVLVLYRRDHRFALEPLLPRRGVARADFDFILASHPYRARASLDFKAGDVMTSLVRGLRANGRLLGVQAYGRDDAMELVQRIWPGENPFMAGREDILARVEQNLGASAQDFEFHHQPDEEAVFTYSLRAMLTELDPHVPMGGSTILAAWNAATYMAQIEDDRLAQAMTTDGYRQSTREILLKHQGLAFRNETFVISRRATW